MAQDAHGTFIDARDLPKGCKPPYGGQPIWSGMHRDWSIKVTRIEGDPLPHVVASGLNPRTGMFEAHAERQEGATPASVRRWVDGLISGETGA